MISRHLVVPPKPVWTGNQETLGFLAVGLFVCLSSVRDVHFAEILQRVSPLHVAIIAFTLCTLVFLPVAAVRHPQGLRELRRWPSQVISINATSALGWIAYLYALKSLEPSLVQILWAGIGPLSVTGLEAVGVVLARPVPISRAERHAHRGLLLALALTGFVALAGLSGTGAAPMAVTALSAGLALISGTAISINTLLCKRLNERGVPPETLVAVRSLGVVLAAVTLTVIAKDTRFGSWSAGVAAWVAAGALPLIVLPVYLNQVGIALVAPITVLVVKALGPVLVFLLQLADGRLVASGYSLIAVLVYVTFAILAGVTRQRAAASPAVATAGTVPKEGPIYQNGP